MFVSKERIQIGVAEFIENEIASKAVGATKFLAYLAAPLISKRAHQLLSTFSHDAFTKDLFDESENVDIDIIYNMAKDAIRKSGQFIMYGIVLGESDVDKLYSYINNVNNIR